MANHTALYFYGLYSVWIILLFASSYCSNLDFWVGYTALALIGIPLTNWIVQAFKEKKLRKCVEVQPGMAVFITGCDTGFGNMLALRLDKMGFIVFAGCLDCKGYNAMELRENASDRLKVVEIDVTNGEKIKKAEEYVRTELEKIDGRLWALVNNAGVAVISEIEFCSVNVYQQLFDVNTLGVVRVTKAFLPLLRMQNDNRVVIVSSMAGRMSLPAFSAYSMSKHAAIAFAGSLRLEMKKWNISVHTIEPTLYKTPIIDHDRIKRQISTMWNESPKHIQDTYGEAYLEDFTATIDSHLKAARPSEKVHEVIDDMVDAVAGDDPQNSYVPNLQTQLKVKILNVLPPKVLDNLLEKSTTPKTPPADLGIDGKRNRFSFGEEEVKRYNRKLIK